MVSLNTISKSFSQSNSIIKSNIGYIYFQYFILIMAIFIPAILIQIHDAFVILVFPIFVAVGLLSTPAFIEIFIRLSDPNPTRVNILDAMKNQLGNIWNIIGVRLIYNIIVLGFMVGMAVLLGMGYVLASFTGSEDIAAIIMITLMIISGVWFSLFLIRFMFSEIVVIHGRIGPIQGINESKAITEGRVIEILILFLIITLLNFIGLSLLGIGLLYTIPLTMMAIICFYRNIQTENLVSD